MIRKALKFLLTTVVLLCLLLGVTVAIVYQQGMVSRSDMKFLVDLGEKEGMGAVIAVVRTELFGVDTSLAADPSYGRVQVEGRGHAPWVIRGNLDDRPRMLKFALRPDIWAAYDTQSLSLYQVWRGSILFEGAAYDYKHGPQPASEGDWFHRDTQAARWFLEIDGAEQAAQIHYLGHEYFDGKRGALMRFVVSAGEHRLQLSETPEIEDSGDGLVLKRSFATAGAQPGITAGFYDGQGKRHLATGTLSLALATTQPIEALAAVDRGRDAEGDELSRGEDIIAGDDCLGCHAEHHRVAGPSWSEISGKFRGKLQDNVIQALARSVREGSQGTWGKIPMPPHPGLSEEDAIAAVVFILDTGEPEQAVNPPLDARGVPYPATRDYDILAQPAGLHPSFTIEDLAPEGFEPKVGGMVFNDAGQLFLATWDTDGAVYRIDPEAPIESRVTRIAEGLHEPLGITLVDDRLVVLQKQELTELIDLDGDGQIDRYQALSYDWPTTANFHSFAFGLLQRDGNFYFLLSICVLPGGASCPEQEVTQGKLLKVDATGKAQVFAGGFRTPNGISWGPAGEIVITDNQGDWLPASKLAIVREGDFLGSRAVPDDDFADAEEVPPAVWLPQDEVGNSPTQSLTLTEGPYAGHMIHGDVFNGGLKRVFLENVEGRPQGAVFHFSTGLKGSINRLERGPDGAIYVGEIGNPPNWGEYGKAWYGLERMIWQGNKAFDIASVQVEEDGFTFNLTQALAPAMQLSPADLTVRQWFYRPDEQYGGPKYNEMHLSASALEVSADRRSIRATIPGLLPGYVVYLRLDERLRSDSDQALWTAEAWYTLNAIPNWKGADTAAKDGWRELFDGRTLNGWRNYGGDNDDVRKWVVVDATLALAQSGAFPMWDMISSYLFGGPSGDLIYHREKFRDFELSLEWKISANGNSGIFYFVADEQEPTPWLTGIEMQVLHNEGHPDGEIETHRAGDLYDMVAANPVTVRPPGQWNEVLIRVQDNHIEHWLNGVKVVSVERGSKQWDELVAASKFSDMPLFGKAEEGYIVLQDHGDPVWYRNIRVRNLAPSADKEQE